MYSIRWALNSQAELQSLDNKSIRRIFAKLDSIVSNPLHFLKSLRNTKAQSLRVGDYRLLIDLDDSQKMITVLSVDHRKRVYDRV